MTNTVDVAIVGAGPYGLSLAAHLQRAGVSFRLFGQPMQMWQSAMPAGMALKSEAFASNLSDPDAADTLGAFCRSTGRPYDDCRFPVPLDTFTSYGRWFAQRHVAELEDVWVADVARREGGYELSLDNGERARAHAVVVAAGVKHFAHVPAPVSALPTTLWSHSSAHADLGMFRGRDVVVLGAGQSALESAALLHETGASARLIARTSRLVWGNDPPPAQRSPLARAREPIAGLGVGWPSWFISNQPGLFRHLPAAKRVQVARTVLGPAGAYWLRNRVEGQFPALCGHTLLRCDPVGDQTRLHLRSADGRVKTITTDHVIAATGYRTDVARLTFLEPRLRNEVLTLAGTPAVGADFQSCVPGLYFTGPAVAPTFGPVMRFVYGADYAARVLARRLAARTSGYRRGYPLPSAP